VKARLLLCVVMHLAYVIHSRRGRVWLVLVALALLGLCIAAFILLSEKSREPFGIDELYGLLD
jgi:hypothetical protein